VKNLTPGCGGLRRSVSVLVFLLALVPAYARTHSSEHSAISQYDSAEKMRDALDAQPEANRSRHDYQRVVNAYRRVYYISPTCSKADPSAAAAAELLVEMGKQFNNEALLKSAIKQYEFLRREYPGSRSRFEALFTIGQIYKDDLHDPERAEDAFQEFLKRYPHHSLAAEAKKALDDLAQQASVKSKDNETAQDSTKEPLAKKDTAGANSNTDGTEDAHSAESADSDADATTLTGVTGIRYWTTSQYTRVAIDLEQGTKYDAERLDNPERIYFDLFDTKLNTDIAGKSWSVDGSLLKTIRVAEFKPGRCRVVLEVSPETEYNASLATNPSRLIVNLLNKHELPSSATSAAQSRSTDSSLLLASNTSAVPKKIIVDDEDDNSSTSSATSGSKQSKRSPAASSRRKGHSVRKSEETGPPAHEAAPTANGDRSLIRALGLKIGKIVIDPGHGGHDTGTIGPHGLLEKDLVLDVSKRLGKLLETRLGADVVYTRTDDTFVPLEERTAIANREQADLFISVHANSSHDPDARGVETYYLNFTSSQEALDVAARENAVSDKSIHELQDLVKKIALKDKIEESQEFASDVQQALYHGLAVKNPNIRDRGVKKAPFIVLIGANMPSILAEISFVSNPADERKLRSPEYRQRIAESLYRGISKYVSGLSGVKVASKVEKDAGQ
jgi:N-acetylmuramoyl-L-alanine amidase